MCSLTEYDIKIYDKAAQNNKQGGNILRFEIHLHKMRIVSKYGISTLADLQNSEKLYNLKQLLIDVLNGIVWTDSNVQLSQLTNREQKQWMYLSNAKSWGTMPKRKAYKQRKKANDLIKKYGEIIDLKQSINTTWERLFLNDFEAVKEGDFFTDQNQPLKQIKKGTFSQLECCVKKSPQKNKKIPLEMTTFFNTKNNNMIEKKIKKSAKNKHRKTVEKKSCKSCGRDITAQRPQSIFCSEKVFGKKAKQCRNKDSNRRRDIKHKLSKAMAQQNFIAITYSNENENYTDILHPTEIIMCNHWLNKIKQVEILH
jgi:hypothetical protein